MSLHQHKQEISSQHRGIQNLIFLFAFLKLSRLQKFFLAQASHFIDPSLDNTFIEYLIAIKQNEHHVLNRECFDVT